MKAVVFHADAEAELIEAAAYYEAQRHDLGKRFLASVQDAINRIVFNPLLYPAIELDVRRCLTRTFPFGVLFRERPNHIQVIAVNRHLGSASGVRLDKWAFDWSSSSPCGQA